MGNLIPDYVSLLETRWILKLAVRRSSVASIAGLVFRDFFFTFCIGAAWWWFSLELVDGFLPQAYRVVFMASMMGLLSTFLTSVWLWLYAASVLVSRVLLRMDSGVGFLLRVTDVEKQPFRSMGFVSVIIVSALFALGLPLVLL